MEGNKANGFLRHQVKKWKMALDRTVTFGNFLDKVVELYGDDCRLMLDEPLDFTFCQGTVVPAGVMRDVTNRMAHVFREDLGIAEGERVIVMMSNRVEIPFACFALMKIGAIAVPLNFMLAPREVSYIASDSGAGTMVTDRLVFEHQIKRQSSVAPIERWALLDSPEGLDGDFVALTPLIEEASPEFPPVEKDPDDVVGIFYTSGTTGFPKGAMMTSRGLLRAQRLAAAIIPAGADDIGLMALPLAHLFGFGITLMSLAGGLSGRFVRSFDPHRILEAIEESGATIFVGVPAMYTMMLMAGLDEHDVSRVRIWGSSADAMPDDVAQKFRKAGRLKVGPLELDSIVLDAYGMVELSALACMKISIPGLRFPPNCVGFPVPPIRTRVVDEGGRKVRAGVVGELAVKGPCVMKGYWNRPEETAGQMVDGGWFRTGDLAWKDRVGRVYFADRKKDVIKAGGYSVFSVEVEQEVLEHPGVGEAAVIGIPHPRLREAPVAVCSLEDGEELTEEDLLSWCRENIGRYKCPRRVIIVPPGDMPRTHTLKVRKRELRERYRDLFSESGVPGMAT